MLPVLEPKLHLALEPCLLGQRSKMRERHSLLRRKTRQLFIQDIFIEHLKLFLLGAAVELPNGRRWTEMNKYNIW